MEAVKIKEEIKGFIVETFLLGDTTTEFVDGDSFMDNGIIDSTGILELISFVEDNYKISIDEAEMVPDNLDSLNHLSGFILQKSENGKAK